MSATYEFWLISHDRDGDTAFPTETLLQSGPSSQFTLDPNAEYPAGSVIQARVTIKGANAAAAPSIVTETY